MAKGKNVVREDRDLRTACRDLRHFVEHPNERSDIIMQQGIYKEKDPGKVATIRVNGVVVGYQVKDPNPLEIAPVMVRNVFVKFPGYKVDEIPDSQLKPIMFAIFAEMFDDQQHEIKVSQTDKDTLKLTQTFMLAVQVERSPDLVSIVGGFGNA